MNDSNNKPLLIFLGGFVVGALIFFFLGQNWVKLTQRNSAPANQSIIQEVKAVNGKVVAKQADSITIETKNLIFGVQTARYVVFADQNTELQKVVLAKSANDKLFAKTQVSSSKIKIADVKIGDEVMVWSATNIAGKNVFTASKIQVRVSQ